MSKPHIGLCDSEAAQRLRDEGLNELPASRPKSNLAIAAHVLREPMFLLLLATGVVYLMLGSPKEAIALMGAIVVVIGITLYQERKTERTLQALRDLASPRALVIRDGVRKRIPGREVVREDLLVLSEGDRVPADAFVLSAINLAVDESLLTGESVPVSKPAGDPSKDFPRPGGDEVPAVYSGTLIVRGNGTALVAATGIRTEIGKLGRALESIQVQSTNLEKETRSVVRMFATASFFMCIAVAVGFGLGRGSWIRGVLAGLALAISLVPEEFPVVLTVFLALGAWRISKQRVLTRRVPAIEMLGSTTVLCVDKTGTLTMNRMAVRELSAAPGRTREDILQAAMFASGEDPVDPMEKALHEAAGIAGIKNGAVALVREYPLSRDLLAMSRVVEMANDGVYDVFAKGAPEAIVQLCRIEGDKTIHAVREMAVRGLRVLGVARTRIPKEHLPDSQQQFDFEFVGLVGLEDPVRPSVPEAIRQCHTAGIRVVMITGDYPATAHSIARQIGLKESDVFARVLPEQKLDIVEAFKAKGEIVAMTGDGVNDAPALKSAHIGIAMGGRGTDVAREAASLVLLDDDFSSIVAAVRLGRRIYDNLQKAVTYVFAIHLPIAGLSLLPVFFGLPLVLMPLHIVFLELVIDPACSIAFESEPAHPQIMNRPPRNPKSRLFDRRMITSAVFQGLLLFAIVVGAFVISLYRGQTEADARAISFTTLVLGNVALIWANRSRTRTIAEMLRSPNTPLWGVTGGALALLAIVLYVPSFRDLFQFSILHPIDIAVCVVLAMASITGIEAAKVIRRYSSSGL